MLRRLLRFFLFISFFSLLFSQDLERVSNVDPYVCDGKASLRVNPVFTGIKGKSLNQESDLNILLFYQHKSNFEDDEILGYLEARLVSEIPLTSYDMFDRIKKDKLKSVEDYGKHFEQYQKALEEFRVFQKKFESEKSRNNKSALRFSGISFYASNIGDTKTSQDFALEPFPNLDEFFNKKTLEEKELEFLIRYEKLKQIYNDAVQQYNIALEEEKKRYKETFDPADKNEKFSAVFFGQENYKMWSKDFHLDGEMNYQSYDDTVWYLQYRIPIKKEDLFILSTIFFENTQIVYTVEGSTGSAQFNLSLFFIDALKELFNLYLKGSMTMNVVPGFSSEERI